MLDANNGIGGIEMDMGFAIFAMLLAFVGLGVVILVCVFQYRLLMALLKLMVSAQKFFDREELKDQRRVESQPPIHLTSNDLVDPNPKVVHISNSPQRQREALKAAEEKKAEVQRMEKLKAKAEKPLTEAEVAAMLNDKG